MQIELQCKKFAEPCKLKSLAIYGGVPRDRQQYALEKGVEILIATPGRLIDFLESRVVRLDRITYLVLDEADRMLVSNDIIDFICRTWDLRSTFARY
jgi:ATP-dependent RNA helicase DDX5/DBP2